MEPVEIRIQSEEIPEGSIIYIGDERWLPERGEQRTEMLETAALFFQDEPPMVSQKDILEFVQEDNKRYPTRLQEADLRAIAKAAYAFKELKPKGKLV